jgi:hypothetical protein
MAAVLHRAAAAQRKWLQAPSDHPTQLDRTQYHHLRTHRLIGYHIRTKIALAHRQQQPVGRIPLRRRPPELYRHPRLEASLWNTIEVLSDVHRSTSGEYMFRFWAFLLACSFLFSQGVAAANNQLVCRVKEVTVVYWGANTLEYYYCVGDNPTLTSQRPRGPLELEDGRKSREGLLDLSVYSTNCDAFPLNLDELERTRIKRGDVYDYERREDLPNGGFNKLEIREGKWFDIWVSGMEFETKSGTKKGEWKARGSCEGRDAS